MMDISNLIKDCVNSVTKSAEFIYVAVADNCIIVDSADTSLGIIPLKTPLGIYAGFNYPDMTDNKMVFNHVMSKWQKYDLLSRQCVVEGVIEDLRLIEEYENMLALKADEGAGLYRMPGNTLNNNFIVPVFTGLPVINKQDKIGIVVKRIDRGTLLMEYHIYKKKLGTEITLLFKTIDMNRSLLEEQFCVY